MICKTNFFYLYVFLQLKYIFYILLYSIIVMEPKSENLNRQKCRKYEQRKQFDFWNTSA